VEILEGSSWGSEARKEMGRLRSREEEEEECNKPTAIDDLMIRLERGVSIFCILKAI
jgi:hypothetical protein